MSSLLLNSIVSSVHTYHHTISMSNKFSKNIADKNITDKNIAGKNISDKNTFNKRMSKFVKSVSGYKQLKE